MGVSVIHERLLGSPQLHREEPLAENHHVRRRPMLRFLRPLLKVAVGLLIMLLLLTVVWVVPVS
jgi:hypothetical protein